MTGWILLVASWLVPRGQRAEWLAEWRSELWHVASCRRGAAIWFALGAFRDALWLKRNIPASAAPLAPASPFRCIALLAAIALGAFCASRFVPVPRVPAGLLAISTDGRPAVQPTVTFTSYQSIAAHAHRPFSALAFCAPIQAHVSGATGLAVAVASPSLFAVLDVAPPPQGRSVVLSGRAWRSAFHSDPAIVGRTLEIDGLPARVAGVIPPTMWPLPVRIDAWLLDPAAELAPRQKGFVLARMKAAPERERWWLSTPNERGGWERFECVLVAGPRPALAFLLSLAIACAVLPAVTSLRFGEYPATRHSPRGALRFRRWIYLGLKVLLLLPAVFFTLYALGWLLGAGPLQAQELVIGYIFAFRWAIADQRRRCPVCLRLLTNPAPIGCASHMFLDWYGAELMCARGHGLLHVPEIPTSCYSSPRWLYLDRSWSSLFS